MAILKPRRDFALSELLLSVTGKTEEWSAGWLKDADRWVGGQRERRSDTGAEATVSSFFISFLPASIH